MNTMYRCVGWALAFVFCGCRQGFEEGVVTVDELEEPSLLEPTERAQRGYLESLGNAPIREARAGHQVVDDAGRVRYIVDLHEHAREGNHQRVPDEDRARFRPRHSAQAVALVYAFERQYGFEHAGMISQVGLGFSAYLAPSQVAALQRDPRVAEIWEDSTVELSAPPPPWSDRTGAVPGGSEMYSWGHASIGGINVATTATPTIYLIDAGVGYHADLHNVVQRLHGMSDISPIGCYPHATHTAGIIGASFRNGGVAGVVSRARIVSVAVTTVNVQEPAGGPVVCADQSTTDGVRNAIDEVYDLIRAQPSGPIGIVNISINGSEFRTDGSLNAPLRRLATTDWANGYKGAFVAQSAGNIVVMGMPPYANRFDDACGVAYASPSYGPDPADGIMVVGGIVHDGKIAKKVGTQDAYQNGSYAGSSEGSNLGSCVEIWAPSKSILSTWGPVNDPTSRQRNDTTYSGYVSLSGTSMAAPFVAGIAAAILQKETGHTPGGLEAAVRSAHYQLGEMDPHPQCAPPNPPCPVKLAQNPKASFAVNPAPAFLANVSTRAYVGIGNDVLIGGFVVDGGHRKVAVKASGPRLADYGVPYTLGNPYISLPGGGINDDWMTDWNAAALQASGYAPYYSVEPGMLRTLGPGGFTPIVAGVGGAQGHATVEVYDPYPYSSEPGRIINLSSRGQVLTGDSIMIGGFHVLGSHPVTLAILARGRSLSDPPYYLNGLANPHLRLVTPQGLVDNDNWQQGANQDELSAIGFAPAYGDESALLVTLPPGLYTAHVSGVGGTTGIGTIEVYSITR